MSLGQSRALWPSFCPPAHEGAGGPGPAPQRPSGWVSAASQEDVEFSISGFISKSQLCVISSAPLEGLSLVKEQGPSPLC